MTAFKSGDPLTLNRLYGRSSGHRLRKSQQELVDNLLPEIEVPTDGEVTSRSLFGDDRPLHLEIGFGSGEHLADRADMLPDHGFIGAEPFLNGVAAALAHIRDKHLRNVRLWRGDALDIVQRLPDESLSFLYLLHPDPWPKARHAKRRLVRPSFVALLERLLGPDGFLHLATDRVEYEQHAREALAGWSVVEDRRDRPTTGYERRAHRDGREVVDLVCQPPR